MAFVYQVHGAPQKRRFDFIKGFSLTTWIVLINVIAFVFFIIMLSFYKDNPLFVYDNLAIKPSNIFSGYYYWTFLTSIFMHGGFFHLFANMISLFFIGNLVEKLLGRKRYFWFYILSGLFAGLFFVLTAYVMMQMGYPGDFNTYAVGASGALFALVGFLMIITPNLPVFIMFIPIPVKMKYAAQGLLVVLWLISVAGNVPIGNTAHLGGLIAGLFYAFYIKKKYKRKSIAISRYFS